MNRRTRSTPRGSLRSTVRLFLFVLSAAKIGPRSQYWSSVCGTPPTRRAPSGRVGGLEVDDLGAEERQHVTGERARPEGRHVEDAQTLERAARRDPRRDARCRAGSRRRRRLAAVAARPGGGPLGRPERCRARAGRVVRGFAAPSLGIGHERPALLEVRPRRGIRAVGDRRVGDAEGRGLVRAPLRRVRSAIQASMVGVERGAVEEERPVLHPLGMADHHAEVQPLLPGPAPEPDEPVAGRTDAGRRHEPLPAHRPAQLVVERHRVVGEAHRQRLEHRHVDELAAGAGAPTGRQRPDGAEEPGEPLPDLAADEDRGTVGPPRARPTIPPDHAWRVNSVAALSLHGPSRPNGRDRRDDQVRMGPQQLAGVQRRPAPPAASPATRPPRRPTPSSACSAARSPASVPSTTTLCLEAPRKLNSAPSSSAGIAAPEADHRRNGSPSGDSTLMTSAPPSASSFVQ